MIDIEGLRRRVDQEFTGEAHLTGEELTELLDEVGRLRAVPDSHEIRRLDAVIAEMRGELDRMRPVYDAARAWRDTWRHRHPFGEESKAVALVDAVDAAHRGRWAACEEPPMADDGAFACGWAGEMEQLRRDRDGVTRCPACGSTAIKEDLPPPETP